MLPGEVLLNCIRIVNYFFMWNDFTNLAALFIYITASKIDICNPQRTKYGIYS